MRLAEGGSLVGDEDSGGLGSDRVYDKSITKREPKSEKELIVECSIEWWRPEKALKIGALQNASRYFLDRKKFSELYMANNYVFSPSPWQLEYDRQPRRRVADANILDPKVSNN